MLQPRYLFGTLFIHGDSRFACTRLEVIMPCRAHRAYCAQIVTRASNLATNCQATQLGWSRLAGMLQSHIPLILPQTTHSGNERISMMLLFKNTWQGYTKGKACKNQIRKHKSTRPCSVTPLAIHSLPKHTAPTWVWRSRLCKKKATYRIDNRR